MSTHLFPIPSFQEGFTTNPTIKHSNIVHVQLDDTALGVQKVSSRTTHQVVTPPTGHVPDNFPAPTRAWQALYPKGSMNPNAPIPSGFSFYLLGPKWFQEKALNAKEVVWSYRLMFQNGWAWAKGGKLPGPFGGVGGAAYACSGGRTDNRSECFSFRLMWRPKGDGELYTYVPTVKSNTDRLLAVPGSKINPGYGISVGRGSYKFAGGVWKTVSVRVQLNDVGEKNGEVQLYVDGKSEIHVTGLVLRDKDSAQIKGMQFETFFGGHTSDWDSPKDQKAWFGDVSAAIVE